MFDKSYHPHGEEFRARADPIGYYKAVFKYVFGKRAVDLYNAMQDFLSFTINPEQYEKSTFDGTSSLKL